MTAATVQKGYAYHNERMLNKKYKSKHTCKKNPACVAQEQSDLTKGFDRLGLRQMEAIRIVGNVIMESTRKILRSLLRVSLVKIQGVLATEDCEGERGSSALVGASQCARRRGRT